MRDGRVRTVSFETRMFTFVELRDRLLGEGFRRVEAFWRDGTPLSLESRRMIVRGNPLTAPGARGGMSQPTDPLSDGATGS